MVVVVVVVVVVRHPSRIVVFRIEINESLEASLPNWDLEASSLLESGVLCSAIHEHMKFERLATAYRYNTFKILAVAAHSVDARLG